MRRRFNFLNVLLLGFSMFLGCTPHSDTLSLTRMDADFDEVLNRIQNPRPGTLEFGERISVKIADIADRDDRKKCLNKFRTLILHSKLDNSNYSDRSSQLSVVEDFASAYLFTLKRCNSSFEDAVGFRLEFLERIKLDIEKMSKVVATNGEDAVIGVHWSADMYLYRLESCYDLHLRYLEENFNVYAQNLDFVASNNIRRQIESTIGKSIRTSEQIRWDRCHPVKKNKGMNRLDVTP